jgi:hypothetical protein
MGARQAREASEPVRWRPGDADRSRSNAPSELDQAARLGRGDTVAGGETRGSNEGLYSERVYHSDDLAWRTRETTTTPIPRLSGSSSLPVDGNVERALSRARLERANGNAPLVGGVGAIAGPGARLGALGAGRMPPAGASASQPVDSARILQRYQPSAADAQARGKPTPITEPSPAEARGARAKYATEAGAARAGGDVAKSREGLQPGRELAASQESVARESIAKQQVKSASRRAEATEGARGAASKDRVEGDARRREAAKAVEGLRRTKPEAAVQVERRSKRLAEAASASTRIATGVAVGAWTGCSTGWWWADSWNDCGWYKPWWTWHMTWSQCYGFGYGFGWGWNSCWWRPSCWSPCYGWSYPSWYWYPSVVWIDHDEPLVVERVVEREVVRETIIEVDATPLAAPVAADARLVEPSAPEAVVQALHAAAKQHLDEGDRAFLEGRYADAVHHYARAVECSPQDGALHLVLADALFATGDYHYCAWSLRRAFELEPALFDAQVDKRGFYRDPAEFDRQLVLAEGFLEDHFLDDDARLVLAANYHWARRHGDCVALLESAFSVGVRDSLCGARILARAHEAAESR